MKAKARLVLLAAVATGVLGALVPSSASAVESYYNCAAKPPGQWCDGRANGSFDGLHSWDYNLAWSPVGGVQVCQRVWKPSTGGFLAGSNCAMNAIGYYYGNVQCACYEAEVKHNGAFPQAINGFADADY